MRITLFRAIVRAVTISCSFVGATAASAAASPLENLPPKTEVISWFGERPDFSPDGREIAFMEKSYGDVFVFNRDTRRIRSLTASDPYASYLRVLHLSNGDYIFVGSGRVNLTRIQEGRGPGNKLWYVRRSDTVHPIDLGQTVFESLAVSPESLKIVFSVSHYQLPELGEGNFELYVAEIDASGTTPKIVNKRLLRKSHYPSEMMEAQNLFDHDRKFTFNIYNPHDGIEYSDCFVFDLAAGTMIQASHREGHNECEGIFPDGQFTTVESDLPSRQEGRPAGKQFGWPIDLYKLKLDGSGESERLTFVSDNKGWNASNPVISPDGKYMAYSVGRTGDYGDAFNGAGCGILLLDLE